MPAPENTNNFWNFRAEKPADYPATPGRDSVDDGGLFEDIRYLRADSLIPGWEAGLAG